MPHTYEVNKHPYLFIDAICKGSKTQEEGYISYRMVICFAIKNLVEMGEKKEIIKGFIDELQEIDSRPLSQDNQDKFFETYLSKKNGKKVVVIIDKSKCCYPLVLYEADGRASEFKRAAKDISEKFYDIFDEIENSEFNEALHCKLEHIFDDYRKVKNKR